MSEVFIFLADGFEEIEGLTVVDLLRRAKIDITMVSITGTKEITGSHGIKVIADELYGESNYDQAKMLVLPGGMPGTHHLGEHKELVQLLKNFNEKEKKIAAICAAPRVLGTNGILEGKKATCYPGNEEYLTGAKVINNSVVVDSNIITGKGMGVAIEFSLAIIESLRNKELANEIAASIQFPYLNI